MSPTKGRHVKFSLYSEIQSWPGKPAAQLYGEVLEQMVNADRLGYSAYAVIEHFFFPKFSISANPLALFAAAAQRTRRINFRTLLHSMPYHNPTILAAEIAVADILLDGRYEFGVGRGHGWMPPKAGLALTPESRERYEESVELLFTALENERFSYEGKHFQVADSGIVPRPADGRRFRVFLGGTSDRTYELAAERGWAVVVPPLLPYAALKEQLDLYRAKCAEHGNEPDIVWIHACYIDEDREVVEQRPLGSRAAALMELDEGAAHLDAGGPGAPEAVALEVARGRLGLVHGERDVIEVVVGAAVPSLDETDVDPLARVEGLGRPRRQHGARPLEIRDAQADVEKRAALARIPAVRERGVEERQLSASRVGAEEREALLPVDRVHAEVPLEEACDRLAVGHPECDVVEGLRPHRPDGSRSTRRLARARAVPPLADASAWIHRNA